MINGGPGGIMSLTVLICQVGRTGVYAAPVKIAP